MHPDRAAESELGDLVYVLVLARRGHSDFRRRRDLAAHLGVAISSLTDWEAGRDAPTLPNLIRWAGVFGLRLVICDERGDCLVQEPVESAERAWVSSEARRIVESLCVVRRERLMTQRELAGHLDVAEATVLRWEHARQRPRVLTLVRWARVLGCFIQLRSMNSLGHLEASPDGVYE